MIVTPGPAILVIPAGLAVLATEFVWARRLLRRFKTTAWDVAAKITGRDAASRNRAASVGDGNGAASETGSPRADLPAAGTTMPGGPLRPVAGRFGSGPGDAGGKGGG
jgi:hypothetical protein